MTSSTDHPLSSLSSSPSSSSYSISPQHVIIDTDPGIDDAIALFLALSSVSSMVVDGITIVMGNHTDMDLLSNNARMIAAMSGQTNIPVFKGAGQPLRGDYRADNAIKIHGANGLGDVPPPIPFQLLPPNSAASFFTSSSTSPAPSKSSSSSSSPSAELVASSGNAAAQFMVSHILTSAASTVTIIAVGPLTNLAVAIEQGGTAFVSRVKQLVWMGGTFDGRGNKTAAAEANAATDAVAAKIVFQHFVNVVIVPLNCTRQVPMTEQFRLRLRELNGVGEYLYRVSEHYVSYPRVLDPPLLHDVVAVMFVLRPDLFDGQRATVDVEVGINCCCTTDCRCICSSSGSGSSSLCNGVTVADWTGHQWKRSPNAFILMKVCDLTAFYDDFCKRLATLTWQPLSQPTPSHLSGTTL